MQRLDERTPCGRSHGRRRGSGFSDLDLGEVEMMRRYMILAVACVGAASACSGPTEPWQTEIVVTIDWSVASEPGFVDARWRLVRYAAGSDWEIDVDSGAIGTDGSATIRFQDDCIEGRDFATTHRIRVSGHFAAHEGSFLPECEFGPVWARCTSVPQTLGIGGGGPAEACTPPE